MVGQAEAMCLPAIPRPEVLEVDCPAIVLKRVCSKLLAIPLQHRPRSLDKLCNTIKFLCSSRSYLVDAEQLAKQLGVPKAVSTLCRMHGAYMSKEVPAETMHRVQSLWNHLRRSGWTQKSSTREVARWIIGQSYVSTVHKPQDVVGALFSLNLLRQATSEDCNSPLDYSDLTSANVIDILGEDTQSDPVTVVRAVPLPVGCGPALIGKGGRTIKALQLELARILSVHGSVQPSVRLSIHSCLVGATLHTKSGYAELKSGADAVEQALQQHLCQLQHQRLNRSQVRKAHFQQRRQEQGEHYHEDASALRKARQCLPSAARALVLPSKDVDGFGSNAIRRAGQRCQWSQAQRRRQNFLRVKRQTLLRTARAFATLGCKQKHKSNLAGTGEAERLPGNAAKVRQDILGSAPFEHILGADAVKLAKRSGTARRVLRQLVEVASAEGADAPRILEDIEQAKKRKSHKIGKKICRQELSLDIAEGVKLRQQAQRLSLKPEQFLRM